jgi:hypothetical protein
MIVNISIYLSRRIYNNVTYLYRQYNIIVTVIFCHTNFVYHSNIYHFISILILIFSLKLTCPHGPSTCEAYYCYGNILSYEFCLS